MNRTMLILVLLGISMLIVACNRTEVNKQVYIECNRTITILNIDGTTESSYTYDWSCINNTLELNYTGSSDVKFTTGQLLNQ